MARALPHAESFGPAGPLLPVAAALGLSLLVPFLLEAIFSCGNSNLPYAGPDLARDYSLGMLWAVFLGFGIYLWPVTPDERTALLRIWLAKALVALVVMLAYEFRYGMDPDGYFVNAVQPDFVMNAVDFESGTFFIRNLTWLHLKIVPDSYHAAKVGFAMVGLISIFLYYRASILILGRRDVRVLYLIALFPSVLFWSSILGKDPIVLFGFSLYVYGIVAFQRLKKGIYLLPAALGVLLCALIRIWLVPITMVPLGVLIFAGKRSLASRLAMMAGGISALIAAVSLLKERFRISTLESVLDTRNYAAGAFVGGGSSIKPPDVTTVSGMVTAVPQAVFSALFRPLPGEILNPFGILEGLCSLALLGLLARAVKKTRLSELKDPLLWWAMALVLVWAAIYGLVTYNLGSLVRYKLQILPTMLGLLLYLGRKRGEVPQPETPVKRAEACGMESPAGAAS